MKFIGLCCFCFIFSTLISIAQEKTETDTTAIPKRQHKFIYHFSLVGNWSAGNINRDLSDIKLSGEYVRKGIAIHLFPEFIFGELNDNVWEREYSLLADVKVFPQKKFYGFGFVHFEKSYLRRIRFRQLFGVGGGWHVFEKERIKLSLSNALVTEGTDFEDETLSINTLRTSFRAKGKYDLLDEKLHLKHLFFFQPSLTDHNLRWRINIGLFVPVSSHLNFLCRWEHSFESSIAHGRKNHDDRWTAGIAITNAD